MKRWLLPLLFAWGICDAAAPFLSTGTGWLRPLINTGAPAVTLNPLGINLSTIGYYTSEQPFLNLVKSGGSSANYNVGWYTTTPSIFDTAEEAYLQLDTDGYPTSLTASPTPGGGQVFTQVTTLILHNMGSLAPGASTLYPAGQYRLKYEGKGAVNLTQDASVQSGDTCGAGVSLTNAAANTYVSCTFHVLTPTNGIFLNITSIPSNTDYPRDISIVLQSNAAAYDGGAIFNPTFLSMLAPFSSLRFMVWENTNGEFAGQTATATVSSGATSLTLTSAWISPTGTYPAVFIDGEQRNITLTLGATTATWTGGLSNTISSTCSGGTWGFGSQCFFQTFFVPQKSWASRSKPSNAFWDQARGIPLEIAVALCNANVSNCYLNVPLMYSDADMQAMGQLVMSGTGMQSGFSGLTGTLNGTFELSNEVWNCFTFVQCDLAGSFGGFTWPAQPSGGGNVDWQRNWYGMRVAQMATDLQTAVGTTIFARVNPTIGGQLAVPQTVSEALATTYWAGAPASAHPIKSINVNPYWGDQIGSTDCTTMTGVTTPLDDFFAMMTGRVGTAGNGSHSYSSVPSNGYFGEAQGLIGPYLSLISGTYPSLKLIAYEGGNNFFACFNTGGPCNSATTCSGWPALVTSAERDPRMGANYVTMLTYWGAHVGLTSANIFNVFDDVDFIGVNGAFGLMESVMQPIAPLSGAPSKYNGVVTVIQ